MKKKGYHYEGPTSKDSKIGRWTKADDRQGKIDKIKRGIDIKPGTMGGTVKAENRKPEHIHTGHQLNSRNTAGLTFTVLDKEVITMDIVKNLSNPFLPENSTLKENNSELVLESPIDGFDLTDAAIAYDAWLNDPSVIPASYPQELRAQLKERHDFITSTKPKIAKVFKSTKTARGGKVKDALEPKFLNDMNAKPNGINDALVINNFILEPAVLDKSKDNTEPIVLGQDTEVKTVSTSTVLVPTIKYKNGKKLSKPVKSKIWPYYDLGPKSTFSLTIDGTDYKYDNKNKKTQATVMYAYNAIKKDKKISDPVEEKKLLREIIDAWRGKDKSGFNAALKATKDSAISFSEKSKMNADFQKHYVEVLNEIRDEVTAGKEQKGSLLQSDKFRTNPSNATTKQITSLDNIQGDLESIVEEAIKSPSKTFFLTTADKLAFDKQSISLPIMRQILVSDNILIDKKLIGSLGDAYKGEFSKKAKSAEDKNRGTKEDKFYAEAEPDMSYWLTQGKSTKKNKTFSLQDDIAFFKKQKKNITMKELTSKMEAIIAKKYKSSAAFKKAIDATQDADVVMTYKSKNKTVNVSGDYKAIVYAIQNFKDGLVIADPVAPNKDLSNLKAEDGTFVVPDFVSANMIASNPNNILVFGSNMVGSTDRYNGFNSQQTAHKLGRSSSKYEGEINEKDVAFQERKYIEEENKYGKAKGIDEDFGFSYGIATTGTPNKALDEFIGGKDGTAKARDSINKQLEDLLVEAKKNKDKNYIVSPDLFEQYLGDPKVKSLFMRQVASQQLSNVFLPESWYNNATEAEQLLMDNHVGIDPKALKISEEQKKKGCE